MSIASPEYEKNRLNNLKSYQIIDTPPESTFDEITKLVSEVCSVPVVLISLIDERRQWFKSKVGIQIEEFPRAFSICSHVLSRVDPLIVKDATQDERFSSHPMVVSAPHFRFYTGFPLITAEGFVLGALCVFDYVVRELTPEQMNMMRLLSKQVVALFERNRFQSEREHQVHLLKAASQLSSLGQMALSVIHEINNPLTILQVRASMLARMAQEGKVTPESTLEAVEKMLETTRRMTKIIGGLTSSIGNTEQEGMNEVSLKELVENTLTFTAGRFAHGQVEFEYGNVDPTIRLECSPVQISQVLVNLLNNAYDAATGTRSKRKWVNLKVTDYGQSIEIAVSDSGREIPDEVAEKIFKPFFTTKPLGKGTGLGLSIAQDIVRKHGGELWLDTKAPNTTFVLRLPKGSSTPALASGH